MRPLRNTTEGVDMPRRLAVAMVVLGIGAAIGLPASLAAGKRHAFTQTDLGAEIASNGNSFENAYQVKDSIYGTGASLQVGQVSGTKFPITGSDRTKTYFPSGVLVTTDKFTLGTPNAAGTSAITGSGKCAGGTRVHRKEHCTYTFTGTLDTKNNRVKVSVKGTTTG